jgi:Icc protein
MPSENKIKARNSDCIRLIQITDTHIFESPQDSFDGLDTLATLRAVVGHIKRQKERPDLVLVTGDLVHDPVSAAYLRFRGELNNLHVPTFCLSGNHDDPALMHASLNQDNVHTDRLVEIEEWRIILLDTHLGSSQSGRLAQDELDFLERSLKKLSGKYVLVCLHHPPVIIGSPWMDAMMLENPEDLFAIVDRHPEVQAIIWGHIHQIFKNRRHHVILHGSPSTCVQFKPGASKYVRDELAPGYSSFQLHEDGRVTIEIIRI